MTRTELVRKMASKMGVEIRESKLWVTSIFDTLTEAIMNEDRVTLVNFGTFRRKIRSSKKRGDINTGEIIIDPAKTIVSFSPSDFLEQTIAERGSLIK
ncbi:MAG: HU family DNA-binding protein [Oscillospiraceae bacterium]